MRTRVWNIIRIYLFFTLLIVHLSAGKGNTRRKRLLHFPEKTNVVLTMSLLKLFPSENILNTLTEYDVLFPVPLHPYKLPNKRFKRHVERNVIFQKLETIANIMGFEGDSSLENFICAIKSSFNHESNVQNDNLLKDVVYILLNLENNKENCTQRW
ncbi:uncharacterized protein LOC135843674 [Planococcus citri]|uniref:uncharacterized protein LOC135843674 n=1 Tax=Planococcus citri TaxID=170843 RepID=UPI0031F813F3